MDIDKRFEEVWRGLITEGKTETWFVKKRIKEVREAIASHKMNLLYAELSLAAGERVLAEYEEKE